MKKINFGNLKWLQFSILLMLLDVGSKYWIKINFFLGEILFISYYCNFYYVCNVGLAFGLFSNLNLSCCWLFIWAIILIIIVFVMFLCESIKYFSKCYYCAYAMIIGGALGNLYDRIVSGTVVDFIDIHINNWHWPTFNIADIEICMGIIILIIRYYCIFFRNKVFSE